ncbi:helix-turn-helix domain-containing protein [Flavonifractor plautii]|uniref:helix-turn-helix domain-containing protein n=1 Tax=Flavonifractor plautii TaxID=292800 RepID=UPI001FAD0F96|nr:helix-turn-helix transcriptional regulator [Flavonifractor plautii]
MEKYYIIADLKRNPAAGEDVPPVPGAQVYVGRMKAIIEAENWETAMKQGQELILGCLKRHIVPYQWVWMPVKDAEKMGDTSIYDRYPTATRLTYERVKAGLTQKQLAERSGVNIRQIQRVELGESEAGNLTAKNLLALADVLEIDPHKLI